MTDLTKERLLEEAHEAAKALHESGVMTSETLQEIESLIHAIMLNTINNKCI